MITECLLPPKSPVIPPQCQEKWLVRVNSKSDITNPTKDHAYITPDNSVYVLDHDGNTLIEFQGGGTSKPTTLANTDGFLDTAGSEPYNQVLNFRQQKLKDIIAEAVEEITAPKYILLGLANRFDFNDNEATGTHNPNAPGWVDLITGTVATLQDTAWGNGLEFTQGSSRVSYAGVDVQDYTIFNTHILSAQQFGNTLNLYPRIWGEMPYHTLYISRTSGQAPRYRLYARGKDQIFADRSEGNAILDKLVRVGMRYTVASRRVDLIVNGEIIASISNVNPPEAIPAKFLGSRGDDERTMKGSFFEHLVYTRSLTDDEIYNNYLASKHLYPDL